MSKNLHFGDNVVHACMCAKVSGCVYDNVQVSMNAGEKTPIQKY